MSISHATPSLLVKQLFDANSCTYTYLLVDPIHQTGAIVDAVKEKLDRDMQYIEELGIELLYAMETHVHADHITSAGNLRQLTGAQIVYSSAAEIKSIDINVNDGDELPLGDFTIKVLATPGHTAGCVSYYVDNMVFTGDALLIRGCGRTDFQHGSAEDLYQSIHKKLFTLPEATIVYPGHDYNGRTHSTIEEEKQFNPRLGHNTGLNEFIEIMDNLNLALPKKINEAVPANSACGTNFKPDQFVHDDFSIHQLYQVWKQKEHDTLIVDNRSEEEFSTGRVPGAINIPLGREDEHIDMLRSCKNVYIYCHSGRRAQTAFTHLSILGLENLICVSHSGMPEWLEAGYPVEN